jgi:hypothetical protein
VDEDSMVVSVENGNSFARSYAGQQVDFSANDSTKVVQDDKEAALSDLDADDRALVQVRAPKSGVSDFTAGKIVAESPIAYYSDGADEPKYYFAGEEPEDYVGIGGDNCPDAANPEQVDADGDGIGDACDDVDDGTV